MPIVYNRRVQRDGEAEDKLTTRKQIQKVCSLQSTLNNVWQSLLKLFVYLNNRTVTFVYLSTALDFVFGVEKKKNSIFLDHNNYESIATARTLFH